MEGKLGELGKEIYQKYDPYNKDLEHESDDIASSVDIGKYKSSGKLSLPSSDRKDYLANKGLQREHTRSEIESKVAAVLYAQEVGDKKLEKEASLLLIQFLDEKIQLFIEKEDYENAGIYIEHIKKVKNRVYDLNEENVFEFKKGETLFLIEEVARLINEADIDREEILALTQENPLRKINLEKQKELLKLKKIKALFFLASLMDNLKNYLEVEEKVKKEFSQNLKVNENIRIRKEVSLELLKETLVKTIRFISFNFCQIDKEALEFWKCDERIENGEVPYFTRKNLKKGVIFPIGANAENFSQVILWAKKFEGENLEKIKDFIFQNQEEAKEFYLATKNGRK